MTTTHILPHSHTSCKCFDGIDGTGDPFPHGIGSRHSEVVGRGWKKVAKCAGAERRGREAGPALLTGEAGPALLTGEAGPAFLTALLVLQCVS